MGPGAQPESTTRGQSKGGQRDSVRPESCKVGPPGSPGSTPQGTPRETQAYREPEATLKTHRS